MSQYYPRYAFGSLAFLLAAITTASAANYYVAPAASGGSDGNPGTLASPFATIQRAANSAIAGDTVFIRAGTYRETVTPANSGTSGARIIYQNYPGETVTLNGADLINSASWTLETASLYHTPLAANFFTSTFNQALQVFVDGEMVTLAKWPNLTTKTNAYPSGIAEPVDISHPAKSVTTSFVSKTRDTVANLTTGVVTDTALPPKPAGFYDGAEIYFQPNNGAWSWIFSGLVTNVPANGTQITFTSRSESGKDFNQTTYDAASRYYLFNKKEFLDNPGEWWHDRANARLYLWAPASANPATRIVEVKKRDYAFNLTNRSYITVRGIKLFACSITTDTSSGGSALGYNASGNVIYPWRGAGTAAASTGIVLDGLRASYLNHFTDISGHFFLQWGTASGLVLSGTGHSLINSTIEKSAGNGVELMGAGHSVVNNTFLDLAYAGTDAAAINTVAAGVGTDHDIGYNTIRRTGRSGITPRSHTNSNAAGGQFKARYHHNDISYFGIQDWDVGGFYVASDDGKFVRIDHNFVYEGRGFISAGVYLDYSKNYIIDHNVVWNVEWGIKVHGQSGGLNNTLVYNNTSTVRNLSSTPYGPFAIGNGNGTNVGTVLRNNILSCNTPPTANGYQAIATGTYFSAAEIANNLAWDGVANSGTDPRFVARATTLDAIAANYTLQAGSAAIDIGNVIGAYTRDGITVPAFNDPASGTAPDHGAFEFGLTAWTVGASQTQTLPPAFSVPPGDYSGSVTLALSNPIPGATIRYTLDGSTPTAATGLLYSAPFSLTATTTVRVLAVATGLDPSALVVGTFSIGALELRGNANLIPSGDTTPALADHTDFGSAEANFSSVTRTFTLTNVSASSITLAGSTPVTLTGSAAFTVLTQPALALAAGASTTFGIRFTPTASGAATVTARVAQAGLPGGGYDFTLAATGVAPQPVASLDPASIAVTRPSASATTTPLLLSNTGRASLNWNLAAPPATGLFTVADSGTNGGPAFAWRDTATGGTTILADTDDIMGSALSLGFSFTYLGSQYTQVYVCSNGFVTFLSGQGAAFAKDTLPSASLPAQSIALLWDDLIDDGSSTITWKQLDSSTFGITYQNVARYGQSSQRITAQILLKSDGRIILQYKDNTIPNGYTIGYQTTASIGQAIAYNTAYLATGTSINRALTLQPRTSWLTGVSPASGTLAAGASQLITLSLDTTDLATSQTFNSQLTLTSNDSASPTVLIPVALSVSDTPSAPTNLSATAVSASQINLVWVDQSINETGFKLERSPGGIRGWTQVATPAANATTYVDTGLTAGTVFYYRLRSTSASGDSAYTSTASATTFNGLQSFRTSHGLAADGSQDTATPANDGVANLLKYAFNMLGSGSGQASTLATPNAAPLAPNGSAGLPYVSLGSGPDAGKLQLTFIRRKASASPAPGVTYAVQFSNDLGASDPWAVNPSATESANPLDATFERVSITDSFAATARRFARVKVTAP
jgi:hypothetical protein